MEQLTRYNPARLTQLARNKLLPLFQQISIRDLVNVYVNYCGLQIIWDILREAYISNTRIQVGGVLYPGEPESPGVTVIGVRGMQTCLRFFDCFRGLVQRLTIHYTGLNGTDRREINERLNCRCAGSILDIGFSDFMDFDCMNFSSPFYQAHTVRFKQETFRDPHEYDEDVSDSRINRLVEEIQNSLDRVAEMKNLLNGLKRRHSETDSGESDPNDSKRRRRDEIDSGERDFEESDSGDYFSDDPDSNCSEAVPRISTMALSGIALNFPSVTTLELSKLTIEAGCSPQRFTYMIELIFDINSARKTDVINFLRMNTQIQHLMFRCGRQFDGSFIDIFANDMVALVKLHLLSHQIPVKRAVYWFQQLNQLRKFEFKASEKPEFLTRWLLKNAGNYPGITMTRDRTDRRDIVLRREI